MPDDELCSLYQRARALIFPQEEDFGIVAVEAQACGCPVIAFAAGGAMEIVQQDTGLFVEEQDVDAFEAAMRESLNWSIEGQACRANAERFSCSIFDELIWKEVRLLLGD